MIWQLMSPANYYNNTELVQACIDSKQFMQDGYDSNGIQSSGASCVSTCAELTYGDNTTMQCKKCTTESYDGGTYWYRATGKCINQS